GSRAAIASSLPASSAAVSCLTSTADFDSCAAAGTASDSSRTTVSDRTRVIRSSPGGRCCTPRGVPGASDALQLDEQGVFVLAARLSAASVLAQVADGLKRGLESADQRAAFARRTAERRLHVVQRLID